MGLSEVQIDRAYRMLYVYSVGCNEMIKQLSLHSLERGLLVGCFWRAFIRLCEEHSKVDLQAEIAELVEEKQNALDELRLTRGCLNEALDDLALSKLLATESAETVEVSVSEGRPEMQNNQLSSEKATEKSVDVHSLMHKCENLTKERDELIFQLEETSRTLRSEHSALTLITAKERERSAKVAQLEGKLLQTQGALEKERANSHDLREQVQKLERDIEDTIRQTADMTWKYVAYERDFPILQKEVAEHKQRALILDRENQRSEQERKILKERAEMQDEMLTRMRKQLDTYEKAVRDLKSEATDRKRLFDDKAREASLNGEEADAWLQGHEALLKQQQALLSQVEYLKRLLAKERSERSKERLRLEATVQLLQENMRALTVGIASLTPRPVPKKPSVSIISEVSSEPDTSRMERRMSRRYSRKLSRRGTELGLGRRASEFFKLQQVGETAIPEEIPQFTDQTSDEEWDELCSELSQQREEMEKLEASLTEERDRRIWMERHVEDSVKQVEMLQLELDQTNLRLVNLQVEKKNREKNLQIAEDQIRKLDRQLESMELLVERKNSEIEELKNTVATEIQRQVDCASECKRLLTTGAKALEEKIVRNLEAWDRRVTLMMEIMRLTRNRVSKAAAELRNYKFKMKAIDGHNAVMLSEIRTLKADLEASSTENISLGYKLQKEEQARSKADTELSELTKVIHDMKLDMAVLEVQLASAVNERNKSDMERDKMQTKLRKCMNNLSQLQSEKAKEDAIRKILQADVDALRLELEALKRGGSV